jgi:hypothetical protein
MKIINRIFYIDVTDVNTTGITNYMETIKNCILETNDKSEKTSAIKEEIKENKNIIWEDYFIPVKYYDETDDHLINERQGYMKGSARAGKAFQKEKRSAPTPRRTQSTIQKDRFAPRTGELPAIR